MKQVNFIPTWSWSKLLSGICCGTHIRLGLKKPISFPIYYGDPSPYGIYSEIQYAWTTGYKESEPIGEDFVLKTWIWPINHIVILWYYNFI